MANISHTAEITGRLNNRDVKRLTKHMRSGTVGPTSLYYAGVTAPTIAAAFALLSQRAFALVHFSTYWQVMLSAIFAAMAGISWYHIFMRWAYRHSHGRAKETAHDTFLSLKETLISIRRGDIEMNINYSAILDITPMRNATLIKFDGATPLMVPDRWFSGSTLSKEAFFKELKQKTTF